MLHNHVKKRKSGLSKHIKCFKAHLDIGSANTHLTVANSQRTLPQQNLEMQNEMQTLP